MKGLRIGVVGAGIAGLTTAIALAKHGHEVILFESTPVWGDVGAGITLAPNAMRGLDHIGVGHRVTSQGIEPLSQDISHWQSGDLILSVDRRGTSIKYGANYVYIHRADLHEILRDEAKASKVILKLDHHLVNISCSDTEVSVDFKSGQSDHLDLLIGADGLKSEVRKLFAPAAPHFTGHIAYRALAPVTPEIQALLDQPGMHIGPGKMVVRYPLRHGSLLNLVFFARQTGWAEDGWAIEADIKELKVLFDDWCDDVQCLLRAIVPGTVYKWAINAHKPLATWNYKNRVTLIGDAAHAMTPFLGQGAATGIEDAIMLARAIDDSKTLKEAIDRYQEARFERTSFVQAESNANADRLQGEETELYGFDNLRNEETLGLFAYDCVSEPV